MTLKNLFENHSDREKGKEKDWGREKKIWHLLACCLKFLQHSELNQAETRSQEFCLGLPCQWQVLTYLKPLVSLAESSVCSRSRTWSKHSNMGCWFSKWSLTCCVKEKELIWFASFKDLLSLQCWERVYALFPWKCLQKEWVFCLFILFTMSSSDSLAGTQQIYFKLSLSTLIGDC